GIDEQVVRLSAVVLWHERPLHARREARAAAAAQAAVLDDVDDLVRRHAERLLQRRITAALLPALECARFRIAEVLAQNAGLAFVPVWIRHQPCPSSDGRSDAGGRDGAGGVRSPPAYGLDSGPTISPG